MSQTGRTKTPKANAGSDHGKEDRMMGMDKKTMMLVVIAAIVIIIIAIWWWRNRKVTVPEKKGNIVIKTGCLTDGDCATGKHCKGSNGLCVNCTGDSHCSGTPATPVCDTATNGCVGCNTTGECDGGFECVNHTCVAI